MYHVRLSVPVQFRRKKIKEMTATPSKERMESCSTVKLTDVNEDEANEETEEGKIMSV